MRSSRLGRKAVVCLASAASMFPLVAGCSSASDEAFDADGAAVTRDSFSYVGQRVIDTLSTSSADATWKGRTWSFTGDNVLDPGWLLQTPPSSYWGTSVASLPIAKECDPAKDAGCDPDFKLFA